ncbi:NAD(P)/FAD-dependent oxidoreductase [Oceanirhabdus sp. W0125-5]|uniref:NAD(P)/FAD-dependent oxidoreductase n=1 Tax=Oceanirhabdus sp. W0125-5 TaxID=2999116 RepID=UPI0022F2DD51|nr:FAD-dependent oxidoreductase [Oceanirhabdus sp. W0125-5]WBW99247.1 FAD-dependent oxidoreductase [Oceanirhabdus sp. W0125-5]
MKFDIVVIGGGPAGLAAALEAKKNGIDNILIIERDRELGGILQQCIHNGFGLHFFGEELTGPEYAERFIGRIKEENIQYMLNTMVINIKNKEIHAINSENGFMKIDAKAIILAMGCRERTRGAINIPGYRPAGVYTAGSAQRFINMEGYLPGKEVVILGSGDIGLIMARRLTLEGCKVKAVVELMPFSGGLTRNIVQCLEDYNIPLLMEHTVTKIQGKDRVEGITVMKVDERRKPIEGTEIHYDCDTLLLSVGLIPENELSQSAGVELYNITGGPKVNEAMETNISGVFACGNVVHVHDLVDYVTEESMIAGENAARFVKGDLVEQEEFIKCETDKGIRYIIPNKIRIENIKDKVNLLMRVDNVYKDVYMKIEINGKVFKKIRKRHVAPGEMERVQILGDDIRKLKAKEIKISLCKEGEHE